MRLDKSDDYSDIIDREHPVSTKHPQMSLYDRAAQFSPFSALTGHEEAIAETGRLTEGFAEIDEDVREALDVKMRDILSSKEPQTIDLSYFVADTRKDGGAYVHHVGVLRRYDAYRRMLVFFDGCEVPTEDVVEVRVISEEIYRF